LLCGRAGRTLPGINYLIGEIADELIMPGPRPLIFFDSRSLPDEHVPQLRRVGTVAILAQGKPSG